MNADEFRQRGKEMIDFIADFLEGIESRRVCPDVKPGFLLHQLPNEAPNEGEDFRKIFEDYEKKVLPGVLMWESPHFHAYYPADISYPSILGELLSASIAGVGFNWLCNPSSTELEIMVLDWFGKMLDLPKEFLALSGARADGKRGGGVIQSSASEACLVALLAARTSALLRLKEKLPNEDDGILMSKLVAYTSDQKMYGAAMLVAKQMSTNMAAKLPVLQNGYLMDHINTNLLGMLQRYLRNYMAEGAEIWCDDSFSRVIINIGQFQKIKSHSSVEKAAMIAGVKVRLVETDAQGSLRGDGLLRILETDKANGLVPFYLCVTLGTTVLCSFDNLAELGPIARSENMWLHVDAAYAGVAFVCPEFRAPMHGIEFADSFNTNAHKMMLTNFDCSALWVKDRDALMRAFSLERVYFIDDDTGVVTDFRNWQIPLGRRFRSLKLWFVLRSYGVKGIQAMLREHVRLAKLFEDLVTKDDRFELVVESNVGLVCFRLKGTEEENRQLVDIINAEGKIFLTPGEFKGRRFTRFCSGPQTVRERHIYEAWNAIIQSTEVLKSRVGTGSRK